MPVQQLLPFILGAIAGPIVAGGAIERNSTLPPQFAALAQTALLSPEALSIRIALALRGIALTPSEEAKK
ncbi:MAG: hypothetical protein V4631_03720 [Pseudomonadota bacterium]